MSLKKADKSPVNGIALKFDKVSSYRYPVIYRVSDGQVIYSSYNRPYMGTLRDAYNIFKKVAGSCKSLEGIRTREDMSERNVEDIKKLGFIFIGGPSGTCTLNDEYLNKYKVKLGE